MFVKGIIHIFLDRARFLRYIVFGGDTVNNRIKELRTVLLKEKNNRKYTQKEFSDILGLSENFIWQIEKGERIPSDRTISDICREFGVNEVWLRTGEGEPFQEESREEQILRAATQTVRSSNEFRKQVAFLLAQLSESDWEVLGNIYKKLDESKKNERA